MPGISFRTRPCGSMSSTWIVSSFLAGLRLQQRLSSRDPQDSTERFRSTRSIWSLLASITNVLASHNCARGSRYPSASAPMRPSLTRLRPTPKSVPQSYARFELSGEMFSCTSSSTLSLSLLQLGNFCCEVMIGLPTQQDHHSNSTPQTTTRNLCRSKLVPSPDACCLLTQLCAL